MHKFLLSNSKKFIKKKSLFSLFMLLQIFLCASMLYSMYQFKALSHDDSESAFQVCPKIVDINLLDKAFIINNDIDKHFSSVIIYSDTDYKNENLVLACVIAGEPKVHIGLEPNNNSTQNEIVLSNYIQIKAKIGDLITIGENEYKVVGFNNLTDVNYINKIAISRQDYIEIQYVGNRKLTAKNVEQYNSVLSTFWANSDVEVYYPAEESFASNELSVFLSLILLVFCFVFVTGTIVLYYYEISSRKSQILISKMCGLDSNKIIISYFLEFFIYLVVQFILGLVVYYLFYAIFARNSMTMLVVSEILGVFGLMMIASLSMVFPICKRLVKHTLSEVRGYV